MILFRPQNLLGILGVVCLQVRISKCDIVLQLKYPPLWFKILSITACLTGLTESVACGQKLVNFECTQTHTTPYVQDYYTLYHLIAIL